MTASEAADSEIIEEVLSGNSEAFGMLVDRYEDKMFNLACHLVGYQEAVDVTQEVFLKAFKGLEGFKEKASFSTWIYRIMFNAAISHRRKSRKLVLPGQESEEGFGGLLEPESSNPGPAEQAAKNEQIKAVRRAINEMEELDREIILLRDIDGRSYVEIQQILEVPLGTVKSRLHRARLTLSDKLSGYMRKAH